MKIISRTGLIFKEIVLVLWWELTLNPKFDLYEEGIKLGMAERFAFKRAVKYGSSNNI